MDGGLSAWWQVVIGGYVTNFAIFILLVMVVGERKSMYLPGPSKRQKIAVAISLFIPGALLWCPLVVMAICGLFALGELIFDFFFD